MFHAVAGSPSTANAARSSFSTPSPSGSNAVALPSAPWNVEIFTSTADAAPTTMAAWGDRIASDNGTSARTLTVPVTSDARHFLVLFRELGASDQCSADNPYRGVISDIRFQVAP